MMVPFKDVTERLNVQITGQPDGPPVIFGHGLGCDQIMWRHVAPSFEDRFRVVLFDHVGHGDADPEAYDPERHNTLAGYADDLLAVMTSLDLQDALYVGHSVSAAIGLLAASREPERFGALVLVAASPRYIHDVGYRGAFSDSEAEAIIARIDTNWQEWSEAMAPTILGQHYHENLAAQLTFSFCRTDQRVIGTFARATFRLDVRHVLERIEQPCLILQCARDAMAPPHVGEYMAARLANGSLRVLDASGHMPHVTVPADVRGHARRFAEGIA